MNINKVVSLNSDTRAQHEVGILHFLITAFLLMDGNTVLQCSYNYHLYYKEEAQTFYIIHGCANKVCI